MQYRVYLFDPTKPRPERPAQAFFNHPKRCEEWARVNLQVAGEGSEVWWYEVKEILQGSWKKAETKIDADVKNPENQQTKERDK